MGLVLNLKQNRDPLKFDRLITFMTQQRSKREQNKAGKATSQLRSWENLSFPPPHMLEPRNQKHMWTLFKMYPQPP